MTEEAKPDIPAEDLIPSLAGGSRGSRRYAAQMLGIAGPEHLGAFFMNAMEHGAAPARQAVAETLGRLHAMRPNRRGDPGPEELSTLAALPYLACLLLGMRDPEDITRVNSARSLGSLRGESEAVNALVQALSDPSDRVRTEAARSLGMHRDPLTGPILIAALGDVDTAVRAQVAAALEHLRDEQARTPLLELLQDDDRATRNQAALALGALGAREAVPLLIEAVRAGESRASDYAVAYLCDMRAVEALPALRSALNRHSDIGLQRSVVDHIGKFGSAEAVPALADALQHGGDPKFRQDAIEVLVELGDRSAVPILVQALERWNDRSAPNALLKLGGREAEDAVIRQVNRSDERLSSWSASLLGSRGITRAMPALRQAVEESWSMSVVAGAARALHQLGDTITGPDMVEWLNDEDPDRRRRGRHGPGLPRR